MRTHHLNPDTNQKHLLAALRTCWASAGDRKPAFSLCLSFPRVSFQGISEGTEINVMQIKSAAEKTQSESTILFMPGSSEASNLLHSGLLIPSWLWLALAEPLKLTCNLSDWRGVVDRKQFYSWRGMLYFPVKGMQTRTAKCSLLAELGWFHHRGPHGSI